MYFSYHNKIKKLIREGQCTGYAFTEDHNGIRPALVLYFCCAPPMPVRQHRWEEYFLLLEQAEIREISTQK